MTGGAGAPGGGAAGGPVGCPPCRPDQVCSSGTCQDVPATCPCPEESYCDLASNRCVAGCAADEHCSRGRYCDTGARTCRDGCRGDAECPADQACLGHACTGCSSSCNDGDPCTSDVCVRAQCTNPPGNDGASCRDDGNPCTGDVCRAGRCEHPAASEQQPCPDRPCNMGSVCTAGECRGTALADGTKCGSGMFEYCLAGSCEAASVLCTNGFRYPGGVTEKQAAGNYRYSEYLENIAGATPEYGIYFSCWCESPTDMRHNFPPGSVGTGGRPRYWSCRGCGNAEQVVDLYPGNRTDQATLICW